MLTREEELKLMAEFIEKKGVTKLAPDERIEFNSSRFSAWKPTQKMRKAAEAKKAVEKMSATDAKKP